jgi:K+-transporting ATPase KdpF subunit
VDPLEFVAQNVGLVIFTVLAIVLMVYLGYSMLRPERF